MTLAKPFQRILVPIDFSDISQQALPIAQRLIKADDGQLHLLHVNQPAIAYAHVGGPASATPVTVPAAEAPSVEQLQTQLKQVGERLSDSTDQLTCQVTDGEAAPAIVDYAKDNQIDLIVMTTHGHTGLTRLLTGSVAEKVVRTASCPVLVVKA